SSMFRDFFASKKFKVLMCIVVILAGFMAYAGANGRLSAAPQELLAAALVPFQRVSAMLSGGISGLVTKYAQIDEVMAQNETLKKRVSDMEKQMVEYDRMQMENQQYKDLYKIREEKPEFKVASGSVIARDAMEQFSSFTLDVGSSSGIEQYDVVINSEGCLVGQVLEAGPNWCKVITIIDPTLNAAAIVSSTRDTGIVTGDAEYAAMGKCVMTNLSRETMATEGDLVTTTGLGGVFPKNIIVGAIEEITPEISGKSMVAVIQPNAKISTLTMAFVITEY
ncbi:MAG: rod shape-determining protein MreC, partial [Oscillospiraceae bacterium]